ncbi:MAG: ComEC family competence protein [Anaerolineaceae bacterium]|nr:ComEC family competence protein [Anaerolineaceae bacterium]
MILPSIQWLWIPLIILAVTLILAIEHMHQLERWQRKWEQLFPLSIGWLLLFFALGILRFSGTQTDFSPHNLAYYNDLDTAEITAIITQPPEIKEHSTRFVARAETIIIPVNDQRSPTLTVTGKLQVSTFSAQNLEYGDLVRVFCKPTTPHNFGDFNYRRFLAIRNIQTDCSFAYVEVIDTQRGNPVLNIIFDLRSKAEDRLTSLLPPDEAALLSGILLGIETEISNEVDNAFAKTGTAHIIAISGANFTFLISALSTLLLRYLSKRWYLPVLITFVILYTVFVGGNAAVLRAAFMVVMTQAGKLFGRKNQGLNSLTFSAAFLCLLNPLLLWDLSFQLSFAATLGLVLFSAPLTDGFRNLALKFLPETTAKHVTDFAAEYLMMSIAAQIFTTPLIAYTFKTLSLSSILANLLILPAQPIIMIFGMLTTLISFIILPFAQLLAWVTWLPLAYTINIVLWMSSWHWASIPIQAFHPIYLGIYFAVFTCFPLLMAWLPKHKRILKKSTILLIGSIATILLWQAALHRPSSETEIHLFDLQQNESILFQLPDRNAILIGRAHALDSLEHHLQSHLTGYTLSAIILPETKVSTLDNINELVERYSPQYLIVHPDLMNAAYRQITYNATGDTEIHALQRTQDLWINKDAQIKVLSVRPSGTAFLMNYQHLQVLIPGGVTLSELRQLCPENLDNISLLILNPQDLENNMVTEWETFSVPVVLVNGAVIDCPFANCYSTTYLGGLHFHSDGEQYWLEADSAPVE